MTPIEISSKLGELTTDKARSDLLKSIEADHEFWIGAHYGLSHLASYPVEYVLQDPKVYGPGVPAGVFTKILMGMDSGALNEGATVDAITAFSQFCTKVEWIDWYRPILENRLRIPLSLTLFNKHCPPEFQVANPTLSEFDRVEKIGGLPTEFIMEPYLDAPRLIVMLRNKKSYVFEADGTPVHRMLPQVFTRFASEGEGTVLEVYQEGEKYTVRDVLIWDQFMDKDAPCAPVGARMGVLGSILEGQEIVDVIEHKSYALDSLIREDINLLFEAGYSGIVLRPVSAGYHERGANILVNPRRKSVLTCTDITEGTADTKYEGRAEYLIGTGTMNRKKFETPVFHGLTFSERGTSLERREELIGSKFDILSCGLDSENKLIFPIFKQWKERDDG